MIGEFPFDPDWTAPALERFEGLTFWRGVTFDEAVIRAGLDLVYLATPYSKIAVDDAGVFKLNLSNLAQAMATSWARRFARAGVTAIAPITLAGDMVFQDQVRRDMPGTGLDPLDHAFWEAWCAPLLSACRTVVIPPIEGWSASVGVWREAIAALANTKRVIVIREGS